jgi:GH15 family glucan-1,4-alpha-glucosidase
MINTVRRILKTPQEGGLVSNSLVFRYVTFRYMCELLYILKSFNRYDVTAAKDGLTGFEGTFNMCTFWYGGGEERGRKRGGEEEGGRSIESVITHSLLG